MGTHPAEIENQVNRGGHNHSANCARDWKRGLPHRAQLARQQFSFDFESDEKKKHSHQSVVNPFMQTQRQLVINDAQLQRHFPNMVIGFGQRRIRNGQRRKPEH